MAGLLAGLGELVLSRLVRVLVRNFGAVFCGCCGGGEAHLWWAEPPNWSLSFGWGLVSVTLALRCVDTNRMVCCQRHWFVERDCCHVLWGHPSFAHVQLAGCPCSHFGIGYRLHRYGGGAGATNPSLRSGLSTSGAHPSRVGALSAAITFYPGSLQAV